MKKFYRKLKKAKLKLMKLISFEELQELRKWLIYLPLINYKILTTKRKMDNEKLKNGYSSIKDLEKEKAKRGEVFHINFGYGVGSEYRYNHYCVVVALEGKIAVVVPLTSSNSSYNQQSNFVKDLGVIKKIPGKEKNSYASIHQIRAVSRARLRRPIT